MKTRTWMTMAALLCAGTVHAHGRLVDLTVYDRTEGRRLPVYWHEGRAYIAGKPGNEYQVSVRNRLREDVLTVVSVDGVNVISGETANPAQTSAMTTPWSVKNELKGFPSEGSSPGRSKPARTADPGQARAQDIGTVGGRAFPGPGWPAGCWLTRICQQENPAGGPNLSLARVGRQDAG